MHRLRIGHTRITHEYLIENTEPPKCRPCNSQITVKHIIIHCQIFTEARKKTQNPRQSMLTHEKLSFILFFFKN